MGILKLTATKVDTNELLDLTHHCLATGGTKCYV